MRDSDPRYSKRLAIVVPYRDRAEHLSQFVPHLVSYFERDKLDRDIDYSIHIVEQKGTAPFNPGKIKNCGFALVRDKVDYVCFHDVDYLPIWADYSWSPRPARLIWHGLALRENPETFFGGVVLFDIPVFERVNGYPNCYWGWGPEDFELGQRVKMVGQDFERRDGTYLSLPHQSAGMATPGVRSEEALATKAVFEARRHDLADFMTRDGLNSLKYQLVATRRLMIQGNPVEDAYHHLVDIGTPDGA